MNPEQESWLEQLKEELTPHQMYLVGKLSRVWEDLGYANGYRIGLEEGRTIGYEKGFEDGRLEA